MTPDARRDELEERILAMLWDRWQIRDRGLARAAIALCMQEAAKVCDPKGDCSEMDEYGKHYAAAIRALIPEGGK